MQQTTKYNKQDIIPQKSKGQNFLKNKHIINNIVDAANITEQTAILEIGPGMGALTDKIIIKAGKVVVIEIDPKLVLFLQQKYAHHQNLKIIKADILKVDINQLLAAEFDDFNVVNVISNLPYYITSPIIFKLLTSSNPKIKVLILMMQKEVGERILAQPNNKQYNNLSVVCQYYCDIKKVCLVGKNNFFPVPKVDSIVLAFTFNKKNLVIDNETKFLEFIRTLFAHKRKTILNNFATITKDKTLATTVLNNLGYNLNLRAENLSLNDFYQIYQGWITWQIK
ncbi:16S rRNA (adenine(1518)-N(6)/adenine(1519)-N(6))-dimethyltransferase RsmA [Spiroplasma chrysopicola]|uniref:Ribosomal RNA small subunit methyltransferase A n=1 Tax=Spiroplasma chrysopicola DF-1 TaxID=1276227 RepID=R4U4U2_9MOLU|nr:16S rRNA (adenine(1518)-N(6)/adenine(1519)-N(6))-dimethyltransferase RsmA [Spiroplasma chrysopicola]AGM25578.1 dimethyladenosine transferase [Spiroplasma chrysopicola DF-1]